jgi:hypothetical protein
VLLSGEEVETDVDAGLLGALGERSAVIDPRLVPPSRRWKRRRLPVTCA